MKRVPLSFVMISCLSLTAISGCGVKSSMEHQCCKMATKNADGLEAGEEPADEEKKKEKAYFNFSFRAPEFVLDFF